MQNNRRDFLKILGSAGAVAAASPLAAAAEKITPPIIGDNFGKTFTVTILQTTDVHCQLHPHDELFWEEGKAVFRKAGGYAHIATYFKNQRKKNPYTFVLDTGDMFQGSELSVKTTGTALVPVLNALNYDLFLPGNWEVVYYKKAMQTLMGSLNAPKVCANMFHDKGDGTRGEYIFPPYYIWNVNGVKIGFVGYTDPLVPLRQSPNYSKGIIYSKPEENLAHFVDVLRNQEGCAYVIILSHLGLSQQISLANMKECEGVDYIFGGDTHERVRRPIICKYSKVVEPGAFGSFVGKLDLIIEKGKVIKENYELVEVSPGKMKADKEMLSLIKSDEQPYLESIQNLIGYSTIPLYRNFVVENPIDTLVVRAVHWQLPEIDIVLSNGFRFCPPRTTPDHTGHIPITEGYLYEMLPIDSVVRTGKVTGKQLREWLEKELNNVFAEDAAERFGGWMVKFDGMQVSFNAFAPKGKRAVSVAIKGEPLDDNKIYSICACERFGDPPDVLCRMRNVQDARNTDYTLHGVMKAYLKAHSPVTPQPALSAHILDAPQSLLTQVRGVDYEFR